MMGWIVALMIALAPLAQEPHPWPRNAAQGGECAGVSVVRNGLAAFEAGAPQIGPYTDTRAYLLGGIAYIYLRCGTAVEIPGEWLR